MVKIEVVETGSAAKASVGTGFFANELGHIITNYHVVSKLIHSPDRYRIEVTDQSGQTDQATVLGVDVVYDLAVLRAQSTCKGLLEVGIQAGGTGDAALLPRTSARSRLDYRRGNLQRTA